MACMDRHIVPITSNIVNAINSIRTGRSNTNAQSRWNRHGRLTKAKVHRVSIVSDTGFTARNPYAKPANAQRPTQVGPILIQLAVVFFMDFLWFLQLWSMTS